MWWSIFLLDHLKKFVFLHVAGWRNICKFENYNGDHIIIIFKMLILNLKQLFQHKIRIGSNLMVVIVLVSF